MHLLGTCLYSMRCHFLLLVYAASTFLAGCSAVTTELLPGIDEHNEGYGYLAFGFDSNWKYPNQSEYLGRPFTFSFSAPGQFGDAVVFTQPDTLKIIELKPGTYDWVIGMIDQNAFLVDSAPFQVSAGTVTNLGNLYVEVPYDENGRFDWKISKIKQSGYSSVEQSVKEKSTTHLPFDRQRILPNGETTRMRNSRGDEFDVRIDSAK